MDVLLSTEGTYPYGVGGVSTWCEQLMSGLADHTFSVVAVIANPHAVARYRPGPNVRVGAVPLWGNELLEEQVPRSLSSVLARRRALRHGAVEREFLPLFERLTENLMLETDAAEGVAECITGLADFAVRHDLREAFADRRAWDVMSAKLRGHPLYAKASLEGTIESARAIYRYFLPLTVPLPVADVTHATAAAFCALPCIAAKRRHGTPFLLTEHGVYLRERILALIRDETPPLQKVMLANLYRGVVAAAYREADRILPVCRFNVLWEDAIDADTAGKVHVVHNGVDPERFLPAPERPAPPTAGFVGRIDELKDVVTLLEAARRVRDAVPGFMLHLYGDATSPEYEEKCRRRAAFLGLDACVVFHGHTNDVLAALHGAQVVVQSSVSEALPFSILEAMMCAKPIVATAVGGVPEALGGSRFLVPPQDPVAFGDALVELLRMPPGERAAVGAGNRQRALEQYTQEAFLAAYRDEYAAAVSRAHAAPPGAGRPGPSAAGVPA